MAFSRLIHGNHVCAYAGANAAAATHKAQRLLSPLFPCVRQGEQFLQSAFNLRSSSGKPVVQAHGLHFLQLFFSLSWGQDLHCLHLHFSLP